MQQLWFLTLMTHAFASGRLQFIFFGQFQLIEVHRGSLKRCRNGPMPVCEQLARYERLQYKRRPKCGPTHTHASTHTHTHRQIDRKTDSAALSLHISLFGVTITAKPTTIATTRTNSIWHTFKIASSQNKHIPQTPSPLFSALSRCHAPSWLLLS